MNEEHLKTSMELIFFAGNAKSMSMQAISLAEEGKFTEAKEMLTQANTELHKSHKLQTEMMQSELQGEMIEKSILLIHAQDHFMGATLSCEMAEKFIHLYEALRNVI